MKVNIKLKTYRAILRILKEFDEPKKIKTPSDWCNYVLNWYIRQMFPNRNDYIDRDK